MFIAASGFRVQKRMRIYPDSEHMATPFPHQNLHAPELRLPFEHVSYPVLSSHRQASYKFK